jgi:hypothetical protein
LFRGVEEYTKIESEYLFATIPKISRKFAKTSMTPIKITVSVCVVLNNLSESRNRLVALTEQLEQLFQEFSRNFLRKQGENDDVDTSRNPTIQCSKETLDKCISDGIQTLKNVFEQCLDHIQNQW